MADKKITALTEATSLVSADVIPVVTDTTGTPTTKKVTITNLKVAVAPDLSTYATLASPTLTGTPLAPTATAGTSTTQIATTAFADPTGDQYVLAAAVFNS